MVPAPYISNKSLKNSIRSSRSVGLSAHGSLPATCLSPLNTSYLPPPPSQALLTGSGLLAASRHPCGPAPVGRGGSWPGQLGSLPLDPDPDPRSLSMLSPIFPSTQSSPLAPGPSQAGAAYLLQLMDFIKIPMPEFRVGNSCWNLERERRYDFGRISLLLPLCTSDTVRGLVVFGRILPSH